MLLHYEHIPAYMPSQNYTFKNLCVRSLSVRILNIFQHQLHYNGNILNKFFDYLNLPYKTTKKQTKAEILKNKNSIKLKMNTI